MPPKCLLWLTIAAAAPVGCITWHRGDFTLVSRQPLQLVGPAGVPVSGEACFNMLKNYTLQGEAVFEFAVRDAISQAPGANALLDATFEDTGLCVYVRGTAVTR